MKYYVTINGKKYEVEVERADEKDTNNSKSDLKNIRDKEVENKNASSKAASDEINTIKAPMPGTILDIKVKSGQSVKKGDILFILEAMKMENEILASHDAVIDEIYVTKGVQVNTGDLLLTLN